MASYKKAESFVAVGSFLIAAILAFIGQHMSIEGDIKGGTLMMVAQFLTLTATIFGIDYKLWTHDNFLHRHDNSDGKEEAK